MVKRRLPDETLQEKLQPVPPLDDHRQIILAIGGQMELWSELAELMGQRFAVEQSLFDGWLDSKAKGILLSACRTPRIGTPPAPLL